MANPAAHDAPPPVSHGMLDYAREWLAWFLNYLRARLDLALLEGREASSQLIKLLIAAAIALVLGVFAYFFLCLALAFALSLAFGGGNAWIWVTLAMGFVHVVGALLAGVYVWQSVSIPFFPVSREELRKDHEWLSTTTTKNN